MTWQEIKIQGSTTKMTLMHASSSVVLGSNNYLASYYNPNSPISLAFFPAVGDVNNIKNKLLLYLGYTYNNLQVIVVLYGSINNLCYELPVGGRIFFKDSSR